MDFTKTYDTSEVAELCHVTRRTVYNWITSGLLKADKVGPRRWVIRGPFLESFLNRDSVPDTASPAVEALSVPLLASRPSVSQKKKKMRR